MSRVTKQPMSGYNPFFGCAIILIACFVFGGIIFWSFHTLRTQDAAIEAFTQGQPQPPQGARPDAAGVVALKQKLSDFGHAAEAKRAATMDLSIAELNALIDLTPDNGYGNFREMIAFVGTDPGKALKARVCFPLNKMRFWEGKRYAIGEADFLAQIVKDRGPDLKLLTLTIPGKAVNENFIEAFSGWHWLTQYQQLETLKAAFLGTQKVTITATGLSLATTP
jgi:hypothetical protein